MIFNEPYSKELFSNFLNDFLPDYQKDERQVRTSDKSILTEVTQLGSSRDVGVTVLEAECEETDSNKRIAITQAAFKVLRDHSISNAIIAFHDSADQWRLSLLTSTLDIMGGKVIKKDSNPRRYSYLLGIGAKTVTPYKYLIEKGGVENIKQLQERFSVEVVNRQFYASIADLFTKLIGGERGATKYPGLLKLNGSINQNIEHQEFAVRLIGRVIFSWFLKEKKSIAGVPIVPSELLSLDAVASNADYYHSILEPLFFELLNKRVEQRHENLRESPFSTVPYLNGGLFSPQYNDFYNQSSYSGTGTPGLTHVPDNWFTELFTILEQYNFTVDENTSYDVDLSIDPEMLGRIFENLLAEINPETGESARKSTGSFYTPREIVDYMVDSSLLEYLISRTGVKEDNLKALISWGKTDDERHPLTDQEKEKVVSALASLTILDPACGSGAFPIGILQKVVYVLQQVDEKAVLWLQNQLKYINSPELRRDIEEKYRNENYDYLRKLGIIRESIFGIDIQNIATEISRLRCFLTLIIEEDVDDYALNRGIRPLPNLDFKFVTANSLIGLPEDKAKGQSSLLEDTTHIDALKRIRDEYFTAPNDQRSELKNSFYRLQKQMFDATINRFGGTVSSRYSLLSSWDPFEHRATEWFDAEWMFGVHGFDIVIGNPPFVSFYSRESAKNAYDTAYIELLRSSFDFTKYNKKSGRLNLWMFFMEKALKLLNTSGVVSLIADVNFTKDVSVDIRRYIFENAYLHEFVHELDEFDVVSSGQIIIMLGNRKIDGIRVKTSIKGDILHVSNDNVHEPAYEFWSDHEDPIIKKIEAHELLGDIKGIKITTGVQIGGTELYNGKPVKDYFYSDIWDMRNIFPSVLVKSVQRYSIPINNRGVIFDYKLASEITKNTKKSAIVLEKYSSYLNEDKILIRQSAPEILATFAKPGVCGEYSLFSLLNNSLFSDEFILAVLNSNVISFYAKRKGIILQKKGTQPQIRKNGLLMLPIAAPSVPTNDILVKLVSKIIGKKTIDPNIDTSADEAEINRIIYELYDLSPEQISTIEE